MKLSINWLIIHVPNDVRFIGKRPAVFLAYTDALSFSSEEEIPIRQSNRLQDDLEVPFFHYVALSARVAPRLLDVFDQFKNIQEIGVQKTYIYELVIR